MRLRGRDFREGLACFEDGKGGKVGLLFGFIFCGDCGWLLSGDVAAVLVIFAPDWFERRSDRR